MDFRDLRVWDEAMELAEQVYAVTNTFPNEERFGLTAQLRRSAVSVPSCIAEGNGRDGTRDYLRFLSMARGSLSKLHTQVMLSTRLGFIALTAAAQLEHQILKVGKLLQTLRKSLRAKLPRTNNSPFPIPHSPKTP
jgi:carbamoyl-phosphate synthase large subunit